MTETSISTEQLTDEIINIPLIKNHLDKINDIEGDLTKKQVVELTKEFINLTLDVTFFNLLMPIEGSNESAYKIEANKCDKISSLISELTNEIESLQTTTKFNANPDKMLLETSKMSICLDKISIGYRKKIRLEKRLIIGYLSKGWINIANTLGFTQNKIKPSTVQFVYEATRIFPEPHYDITLDAIRKQLDRQ